MVVVLAAVLIAVVAVVSAVAGRHRLLSIHRVEGLGFAEVRVARLGLRGSWRDTRVKGQPALEAVGGVQLALRLPAQQADQLLESDRLL